MSVVTAGPEMVHLIQAQPGGKLAKNTHCPGASEHTYAHASIRTQTHTYIECGGCVCRSAIHQLNRWLTKAIFLQDSGDKVKVK